MSEELREVLSVIIESYGDHPCQTNLNCAVAEILARVEREKAELIEVVKDLMYQFAGQGKYEGKPAYSTDGLSVLESTFRVLGWKDPHPCPQMSCQIVGCNEWATCGTPTKDGYKHVCGEHFREINNKK